MSTYAEWKKGSKSYLKLGKGEKYECIFRSKEFDPEGGMKGTGSMKYYLEDLKDHVVREMSSSSHAFDDATSRLAEGDRILIVVGTNPKGGKSYSVTVVTTSGGSNVSVNTDDDDDVDTRDTSKVPF